MSETPQRLDPATAPLADLTSELARLVTRYRIASHLVAERDIRPDGIDDDTLTWWIAAHRAAWDRRFELDTTPPPQAGTPPVALRRERNRDPRH